MVVYHGSPKKFTKFKSGKTGYLGGAIYITDDIKKAKQYTYNGSEDDVMKLYARITNPFLVTTSDPAKEILYTQGKNYLK